MQKFRAVIVLLIALCLFSAGFLTAQTKKADQPDFFATVMDTLEVARSPHSPDIEKAKAKVSAGQKLIALYSESTQDSKKTSQVVDALMATYSFHELGRMMDASKDSAANASRVSNELQMHFQTVQILQNQRIIQLLEQMAKKP